jgi:hypothetical protein
MRIACTLGVLLMLVAAGCSATEEETTTVTTTVTAEAEAEAESEPGDTEPPAKGPYGVMGPRVFGPVNIGVNDNAVRAQFGMPDKVAEVNFGSGDAPQTNWIWRLRGGTVTLKFDNSTGMLAGFSTTSPEIESSAGVSVGDSIQPVRESEGDRIVPSPIGTDAVVLSEGEPGTAPALTFALAGQEIVEISGGAISQPAGE